MCIFFFIFSAQIVDMRKIIRSCPAYNVKLSHSEFTSCRQDTCYIIVKWRIPTHILTTTLDTEICDSLHARLCTHHATMQSMHVNILLVIVVYLIKLFEFIENMCMFLKARRRTKQKSKRSNCVKKTRQNAWLCDAKIPHIYFMSEVSVVCVYR